MTGLNLGNNTYNIIMTTQSNAELGENNRGKIWYEKLNILVDKELPDTLKIQTLYHEIAHGVCQETSFNDMLLTRLGDNGYEIFVDNLGKALYDLIHKNNLIQIENEVKGEN